RRTHEIRWHSSGGMPYGFVRSVHANGVASPFRRTVTGMPADERNPRGPAQRRAPRDSGYLPPAEEQGDQNPEQKQGQEARLPEQSHHNEDEDDRETVHCCSP